MNRLIFLLAALALFVAATSGCTKAKADQPDDLVCNAADSAITYTNSMKAFFDIRCATAGCHDAATAYSSVDLSSYAAAKNATQNLTVICAINHECGTAMPYMEDKLADSLIHAIECWNQNGCPQ